MTSHSPVNKCFNDFEEITHTADLALRIRGKDLADLMVNAARGMNALMFEGPLEPDADETRHISVSAFDAESLLVAWLSELAFLAESEGTVFHTFSISSLSETELTSVVIGKKAEHFKRTIKAVTYHNLAIIQTDQGLETTVVFDV